MIGGQFLPMLVGTRLNAISAFRTDPSAPPSPWRTFTPVRLKTPKGSNKMKIPIEQILPDPDLLPVQGRAGHTAGRELSRFGPKKGPVVRPDGRGRFMLVSGGRQYKSAMDAGAPDLDCTVRSDITDQEEEEFRLAEMYASGAVPPMDLGRAFMGYRDNHHVTQQELARRTGITPGTIHHYESLIRTLDPDLGKKVNTGELTFKEARSIADILDHKRQREIAAPFLDGRLSSVHVERVVGRAKSAPELTIGQMIEEVLNGTRIQTAPKDDDLNPVPPPQPVFRPDTDNIETTVLRLAGELDSLRLQAIPEYRRLKLISSLRILDSRLRYALVHMNGGQAYSTDRPRPLSRA